MSFIEKKMHLVDMGNLSILFKAQPWYHTLNVSVVMELKIIELITTLHIKTILIIHESQMSPSHS